MTHILIIDADRTAAETTGALAQSAAPSANVRCETTPERAWHAMQADSPDLVVVDPAPFGVAGRLLIELCNDLHPAARIVVLASAPATSICRSFGTLAIDLCLEKPIPPVRLRDALRSALQRDHATGRRAHTPTVAS
jgi:DNA-binding NarL/FixJ family response regulator